MAKRMQWGALLMALGFTAVAAGRSGAEPLGLPPVPIPADNPQTPEKIALGDKLFHDARFSGDGTISCSTCHADEKAFTDSPRKPRATAPETAFPNVPGSTSKAR